MTHAHVFTLIALVPLLIVLCALLLALPIVLLQRAQATAVRERIASSATLDAIDLATTDYALADLSALIAAQELQEAFAC